MCFMFNLTFMLYELLTMTVYEIHVYMYALIQLTITLSHIYNLQLDKYTAFETAKTQKKCSLQHLLKVYKIFKLL